MQVRDATPADAVVINMLYNNTVTSTTVAWTEAHEPLEVRQAWLERQLQANYPVLVAEIDGAVVGFASYGDFRDSSKWPGYRFTVEHSIHIHPDHQGHGVGSALLVELFARAVSGGKHVMIGAVDSSNVGSLRFHEQHGFVEVARMPETGFKFGRWLDLVLVQRILVE
jgi:phosphinothricin acetyltransferase